VIRNAAVLFEFLRWVGAAYLIWLGIQAWRHAGETAAAALPRGHLHVWRGFAVAVSNPKSIAFFTAFFAAIRRPRPPGRTAARADVRRLRRARRVHRFRLGRRSRARAGMVHAVVAGEIIGPAVRRSLDRRRSVAFLGAAPGIAKLDRPVRSESLERFAMMSDVGKGPTPLGQPSDHSGPYLSSRFRHLMIASAR
jgi:LysE type translocator